MALDPPRRMLVDCSRSQEHRPLHRGSGIRAAPWDDLPRLPGGGSPSVMDGARSDSARIHARMSALEPR
jgi:hypothetical protein